MSDLGDWSPISDVGGGSSGGSSFSGGGGSSGLFNGISGAVGAFGGAFNDLMSAKSYKAEANSYRTAAAIAGENINLEEEATKIKQYSEGRKLNKALGAQQAEIAGAGFEEGGTGFYLARESAAQGHLAEGTIGIQGQINENAYREQQQNALGEAQAADIAASKAQAGGFMGILGGVLSIGKMFL